MTLLGGMAPSSVPPWAPSCSSGSTSRSSRTAVLAPLLVTILVVLSLRLSRRDNRGRRPGLGAGSREAGECLSPELAQELDGLPGRGTALSFSVPRGSVDRHHLWPNCRARPLSIHLITGHLRPERGQRSASMSREVTAHPYRPHDSPPPRPSCLVRLGMGAPSTADNIFFPAHGVETSRTALRVPMRPRLEPLRALWSASSGR